MVAIVEVCRDRRMLYASSVVASQQVIIWYVCRAHTGSVRLAVRKNPAWESHDISRGRISLIIRLASSLV
jgi:hypothetical protein